MGMGVMRRTFASASKAASQMRESESHDYSPESLKQILTWSWFSGSVFIRSEKLEDDRR